MKLDMESLRVLDAIIEAGSFGRAAERLCKAQSAISYQIKKLEQQLGFEIFDRSSYRATLTARGEILWSEGRRMLELASRIEHLASRYQEGWEPSLQLVIDAALPMDPVLSALKTLVQQQIPTRTQVKVEALGGVQQRFQQDRYDLMLVKDYQPRLTLKAIPLPAITVVLVAHRDHPLSEQSSVNLDQLYDHVELTIQDSREDISAAEDPLQFGGDRVFFMNGFVTKKNALLQGLGFGWMPLFMIGDEIQTGELQELKLETDSRVTFTPQLVYDTQRPLGKAGEMISELILKEYRAFADL
ncbi:MAG: LysR family transcriptional regulator [Motiliproteus sp.]|nr:LysR family transcriptional regulator [Motiliproteus sp.]MCW9054097.1 LysR family transcriptional regulator [Motiliproteus sp.]